MSFNWKHILGSVALSATALSMIGTDGAVAKGKSATIPPEDTTLRDIGLKRTKAPKSGKTSFLLPRQNPN